MEVKRIIKMYRNEIRKFIEEKADTETKSDCGSVKCRLRIKKIKPEHEKNTAQRSLA